MNLLDLVRLAAAQQLDRSHVRLDGVAAQHRPLVSWPARAALPDVLGQHVEGGLVVHHGPEVAGVLESLEQRAAPGVRHEIVAPR